MIVLNIDVRRFQIIFLKQFNVCLKFRTDSEDKPKRASSYKDIVLDDQKLQDVWNIWKFTFTGT